jgi:hypothetical protein
MHTMHIMPMILRKLLGYTIAYDEGIKDPRTLLSGTVSLNFSTSFFLILMTEGLSTAI